MPRPARSPQHDVEMGVSRGRVHTLRTRLQLFGLGSFLLSDALGNTPQQPLGPHSSMTTTQHSEPTSPSNQSSVPSNYSSATTYDASNPASTPSQSSPGTHVKSPPLNPSAPGDWVVDNHRDNVVTALQSIKSGEQSFRVHFAEMQRMHMRKVQVKLIKHGVEMRATNRESPGWEEDLKQYSEYPPPHHLIFSVES